MEVTRRVVANYAHPRLAEEILERARARAPDRSLRPADLADLDEMHLGGHAASVRLVSALAPGEGDEVLDVGSGLGGAARGLAAGTGARVHGVDLTPDLVAAATTLTEAVGLGDLVDFVLGDAAVLPFPDGAFSHAMMLHVGMNVPDKGALLGEVHRVLRPGGLLAVYDVVQVGETPPTFPLPWAADDSSSFLASAEDYRGALRDAGFALERSEDLTSLALAGGPRPPAPGEAAGPSLISLLPDGVARGRNLGQALRGGLVAPWLFVARAP